MATTKGKGAKSPKKVKKTVTNGKVFIQSTYNNTIVTITDMKGNTVTWSSAGNVGFRGSRKNTPYAAQQAAYRAVDRAVGDFGMQTLDVYFKGPGAGKDAAVRAISNSHKIKVGFVKDVTSAPHNGCRPSKRRRM